MLFSVGETCMLIGKMGEIDFAHGELVLRNLDGLASPIYLVL